MRIPHPHPFLHLHEPMRLDFLAWLLILLGVALALALPNRLT